MIMESIVSKTIKGLYLLPDAFLEKVCPTKPYDFLKSQGESFTKFLPYVAYLNLDRPTCLLNDGSLGVMWEFDLIQHEAMAHENIMHKLETVSNALDHENSAVSFQIIFDSEPELGIKFSEKYENPKTSPEFFIHKRIENIGKLAFQGTKSLRLMKRRLYLVLRYSKTNNLSKKSYIGKNTEISLEANELANLSQKLKQVCDEVEYNLRHAGVGFKVIDANDFLLHLRAVLHSIDLRKTNNTIQSVYHENSAFSEQVLKDFIEVTPNAVGVGEDTWEVLSWLDQPAVVYFGLFAKILTLTIPTRIVLNIRKCADISDLERKKFLLKNAVDSFGEMQREAIKSTQDCMARGENLLFVSMHILTRNYKMSALDAKNNGIAKQLVSQLKTLTQIDFVLEKYAASALFMFALPFGFSSSCAGFCGREKRVLSNNIAPYLPILGGFRGTKNPFQLMISRSGDAIWLNPFDTETSPHVAILASSGGGKSFFAQNMMMSFLAVNRDKNPMIFIIDKKTSYEIFAKVVGEESGAQIVKPPEYFPNIFKGKLDEYRLPVIVGILKTAISLVTPTAQIGAQEETVLSQAVKDTFEQNVLDATTEFTDGMLREKRAGKIQIPQLSDVVQNLSTVCIKLDMPTEIADKLKELLSSFLGNGAYKCIFNTIEYDDFDPKTPAVSLFDIDFVANHPVLSTLTTQMILSELLRQIRRPENIGRPGMLVIEEVGVLAQGSLELVQFIQDAWKTFRKLGFSCVGLTNEVDDYVKKAGAREIWNVSANKIILKMAGNDLQKAIVGEAGFPPLFNDKLVGDIIASLKKEDGKYAQGFWWSDDTRGSFVYIPTGFDYWCSASKPIEVGTVYEVAKLFSHKSKPFFEAVCFLATKFPNGVRNVSGALRTLTQKELDEVKCDEI